MCRLTRRLRGFEPLRCCEQGGLDRGDFPEPSEGADVWFEPTSGQPTVLQTGGYNVLICGNSNRNADPGTYRQIASDAQDRWARSRRAWGFAIGLATIVGGVVSVLALVIQ
jgi:hypothetical protein